MLFFCKPIFFFKWNSAIWDLAMQCSVHSFAIYVPKGTHIFNIWHFFVFCLCCEQIRAMQNLVIYSLPERKEFYPEVVLFFCRVISFNFLLNKSLYFGNIFYLIIILVFANCFSCMWSFPLLQILNMLEGSHDMACTLLFSHFDQFRVQFYHI